LAAAASAGRDATEPPTSAQAAPAASRAPTATDR
jgi:hypothetical protein